MPRWTPVAKATRLAPPPLVLAPALWMGCTAPGRVTPPPIAAFGPDAFFADSGGFDPAEETIAWRANDRALFHVTLREGDEVRERRVRLEGAHPSEPDRSVVIELVGARRGRADGDG